jgi:hypothetical protein
MFVAYNGLPDLLISCVGRKFRIKAKINQTADAVLHRCRFCFFPGTALIELRTGNWELGAFVLVV